MGYNKYRYNLNNISGETSGMSQTLCICSSSPQYIRHEVENLSLCLIATAWRKTIKFRSAQRNTEQSQFYQCVNGDSHYFVTPAFSLFLIQHICFRKLFSSDLVMTKFHNPFFLKCCFQNRYLEMWSKWLLSLFECHDSKTQIYMMYCICY